MTTVGRGRCIRKSRFKVDPQLSTAERISRTMVVLFEILAIPKYNVNNSSVLCQTSPFLSPSFIIIIPTTQA
jgi:hypothetical protein